MGMSMEKQGFPRVGKEVPQVKCHLNRALRSVCNNSPGGESGKGYSR